MLRLSPAIKAAVVFAVPLLACSTYYTLEHLQNAGPFLYFATSVALPVLLLGLAGVAHLAASGRRTGAIFWLSVGAVLVSALFLANIWL